MPWASLMRIRWRGRQGSKAVLKVMLVMEADGERTGIVAGRGLRTLPLKQSHDTMSRSPGRRMAHVRDVRGRVA